MLWRLTGEVADARYALQDTLDKVCNNGSEHRNWVLVTAAGHTWNRYALQDTLDKVGKGCGVLVTAAGASWRCVHCLLCTALQGTLGKVRCVQMLFVPHRECFGRGGTSWLAGHPTTFLAPVGGVAGLRSCLGALRPLDRRHAADPGCHFSHTKLTCRPQVVWLDCAAARARYGRWIGGTLPTLGAFPTTGRARGGSKQQAQQAQQDGGEGGEEQDDADRHWVYLRRLR